MKTWTSLQEVNLVLGVVLLIHSIGGMVVNPDFTVGSDATAETWLLMDWNGWHALSGIVVWSTAIAVSSRADWSRLFAPFVVAAQALTVIWMLFDPRPFGLVFLPTTADLIFHATTGAVYSVAIVVDRNRAKVAPAR